MLDNLDTMAERLLANAALSHDPAMLAAAQERLEYEQWELACLALGGTAAEIAEHRDNRAWLLEWLKIGRPAWGIGLTAEQVWLKYRLDGGEDLLAAISNLQAELARFADAFGLHKRHGFRPALRRRTRHR